MSAEAPPLVTRIVDLVEDLRRMEVPVAVSESIDAVTSVRHVDLVRREELREALAAVLVKSHAYRATFDDLFDVHFPARRGLTASRGANGEPSDGDPEEYLARLLERLLFGDEAEIRRMAREAVDRYGTAEGREGEQAWFQYRVLRVVDLDALLERMLRSRTDLHGGTPTDLERKLWREEFAARLRTFQEEVEAEVRRRYAEQRGRGAVTRRMARTPLEERDFFRLSAEEQREMRAAIRPLARKLASRLASRRRRGRDGRLDVRRTLRRSMSTGGVPFEPHFRPRRPHKPEIFLLCDVSGSVAAFARFTLLLVHALQGEFSRVRSFAFVDTLDEVTDIMARDDLTLAVSRMLQEADLVWFDGHSDYGHSLEVFHRRYARDITPRASIVVLGDARNNYRKSNAWVLEDLGRRARRVLWLNPEARAHWGTGDSIAQTYAVHTDEMVEVRNLRQLAAFVERLV
jgi:uncharacterized protein